MKKIWDLYALEIFCLVIDYSKIKYIVCYKPVFILY